MEMNEQNYLCPDFLKKKKQEIQILNITVIINLVHEVIYE